MKRVLSFLPAAAAGLLAGWLVSKFFIHPPQPETGEQPSELARLIAGDAAPKYGAPEAWAALLAARGLLPLPPDDGGIRDGVYSLGNLRADHSFFTMHPARRELELELARFGLSEAALSKAGWPGFGSDAGLVETFGRLARKNPGRALAEVDRLEARSPGSDAESLSTARERIFREWVKQDPQAALRAAVDDPGDFRRPSCRTSRTGGE